MIIVVNSGCGQCPVCLGSIYEQIYAALFEYMLLLAVVVIREKEGFDDGI